MPQKVLVLDVVDEELAELVEEVVAGQLSAAFQYLEAEKDACVVVVYSIPLRISERRLLILSDQFRLFQLD
jgi:hypothetical protein